MNKLSETWDFFLLICVFYFNSSFHFFSSGVHSDILMNEHNCFVIVLIYPNDIIISEHKNKHQLSCTL